MTGNRRHPPDDTLAAAGERALRLRFRTFLAFVGLLAGCVVLTLAFPGTPVARWALASTGWIVGFGVPWLVRHLEVPFAGRVGAVLLQLAGLSLGGSDPRDQLWSLADLPVLFFLAGWGVDLCLRRRARIPETAGRILFSLLWLYLVKRTAESGLSDPAVWWDIAGMLAGLAAVWLPRGRLVPTSWRADPSAPETVSRGMRRAGLWVATRCGIALLILLPSLIYLDLLDLPPLLRSEWDKAAETGGREGGEGRLLFWTREARGLTAADFAEMEVRVAAPDATAELITAIRTLRRDPREGEAAAALAKLGFIPLEGPGELEPYLGKVPVFYLDRRGSGDDRITAGLFSSPEPKWAKWAEVRALSTGDIDRLEQEVRRSTLVILAGGVLILLLLGGSSGGVTPAWWLAIFLAGTHIGWVGDSLDLVVGRVRFSIWRDYAEVPLGGTLFGFHTLLLFFARGAEWLTSNLVAQSGLWVALCWPARPGPLLRSALDRFWLQAGKVALVTSVSLVLRFGFLALGVTVATFWAYGWLFVYPVALVGAGWLFRRRRSTGVRLPVVGALAAAGLLLRGWVPLLTSLVANANLPPGIAAGLAWTAVAFAVATAVLLILALERGAFLSPPHLEGQLWLVAMAAIPFLETVVYDPVEAWIEGSQLFLGTTVGWLAFAAAVWVTGPAFVFLSDFLSRWRAKGLDRIAEFDAELIGVSRSPSSRGGAGLSDEVTRLLDDLGIGGAEVWRHLGGGRVERVVPPGGGDGCRRFSSPFAASFAATEGARRLEEMRSEWRWAPFHDELERWFREEGDLLLVPAIRDGELLGYLVARDLPEHRFLLRPAVAESLGAALAAAFLIAPAGVPDQSGAGLSAPVT